MAAGYGPWIDWAGRTKKCPIAIGARHQIRFRDESIVTDDSPETWDWKHGQGPVDIIAYRLEVRK